MHTHIGFIMSLSFQQQYMQYAQANFDVFSKFIHAFSLWVIHYKVYTHLNRFQFRDGKMWCGCCCFLYVDEDGMFSFNTRAAYKITNNHRIHVHNMLKYIYTASQKAACVCCMHIRIFHASWISLSWRMREHKRILSFQSSCRPHSFLSFNSRLFFRPTPRPHYHYHHHEPPAQPPVSMHSPLTSKLFNQWNVMFFETTYTRRAHQIHSTKLCRRVSLKSLFKFMVKRTSSKRCYADGWIVIQVNGCCCCLLCVVNLEIAKNITGGNVWASESLLCYY